MSDETEKPKATVLVGYDGWSVSLGDKYYSWDHNDEMMGTHQIARILEDLGYNVTLGEEY